MKKKTAPLVYKPKALIPGYKIEAGLDGLYAAIPDRKYKGYPFIIRFWYLTVSKNGEKVYAWIEKKIDDWNRADRFRRFMDKWGRGAYTLGYFKVVDAL